MSKLIKLTRFDEFHYIFLNEIRKVGVLVGRHSPKLFLVWYVCSLCCKQNLEVSRAEARNPKARGPTPFFPARQARGPTFRPEIRPETLFFASKFGI